MKTVTVAGFEIANDRPFTLFGGVNVLESFELTLKVAEEYKKVTDKLGVPLVFKASFDKANRSSSRSYRGPGLNVGLEWLSNDRLMLCERGTMFGYNNLVVDMLGLSVMKKFSYPVLLDATHALQLPGGLAEAADGRRENVTELSLAGLSQGLAGLFIEAHPDPESALCDGPCALRLDKLAPFLDRMVAIDALIKQFEPLDTR